MGKAHATITCFPAGVADPNEPVTLTLMRPVPAVHQLDAAAHSVLTTAVHAKIAGARQLDLQPDRILLGAEPKGSRAVYMLVAASPMASPQ